LRFVAFGFGKSERANASRFGSTFGFDGESASFAFSLEFRGFCFGLRDLRLFATFGS
jgi:hypothetical protein